MKKGLNIKNCCKMILDNKYLNELHRRVAKFEKKGNFNSKSLSELQIDLGLND